MTTYWGYDPIIEEEAVICKVTASDISKAEKELSKYMQKKGQTYGKGHANVPTFGHFCTIYFGLPVDDYVADGVLLYNMPDVFVCTNKNVADKAEKFFSGLDYHNRISQTYCHLERKGNRIYIYSGSY